MEGDTGGVDGFKVADPPNLSLNHYETEPAELIKTGQDGVLDASWTVGGRVKGRENIEREKQLRDLDRWAAELKAEAEKEVEIARTEKKKREEEANKARTDAGLEVAQVKREKERLEQEAQKAADLARQWKEYSEQVEKQAKEQKEKATEAKVQDEQLELAEEKMIEEVKEVEEAQQTAPAKTAKTAATRYVYDEHIAFVSKVQMLIMLCSALLTFYMITQTDILPIDIATQKLDRIGAVIFFHTFFSQYYLIGTASTIMNPEFGAIASCARWDSGTEAVLIALTFGYVGTVVWLFLAALSKAEWFCRLFQVCSLLVAADAKIQAASSCPMKAVTMRGVLTPYLLGLALYVLSLLIEVKILESRAGLEWGLEAAEGGGEEENWEVIQQMDDRLVGLLKALVMFGQPERKQKVEDEEDGGGGLFSHVGGGGGGGGGGVGDFSKRRRQINV
ncbi:hypothetical protein TL16_g07503 [Triparma laevis f. inornata]|uniref:Uncharacterized protein n=1 Tax=Triparma laevis f. inornata TaxID=1714386 RepID=A0A9W7B0E5_9STRA|nr:hypothetical protein TL16_g07503 [Triparma laevis f. inornata]